MNDLWYALLHLARLQKADYHIYKIYGHIYQKSTFQ